MLKRLLGRASPAGPRGRLSVVIFHRVLAEPDPLFPGELDARRFDLVCGWLASWFNVLPLDSAVQRLRQGTLPERALSISFDDGYADNRQIAQPVLARHGLPATFFIATGFLDGGRMWNDTLIEAVRRTSLPVLDLRDALGADAGLRALGNIEDRRATIDALIGRLKYMPAMQRQALADDIAERSKALLPDDLMMTSADVRALRDAGMQIGAHTVSHPILRGLPAGEVRTEMIDSRRFLENLLGERVGLFAYPNGKSGRDYAQDSVGLAREAGFDAAVSTDQGAARHDTDPFRIPRFTPWDRTRLRFGGRLLSNLWSSR